jgi:GT2 family glycosyltransferase
MVGPAGTYQSTHRLMLDNRPRLETLHQFLWGEPLDSQDWGFFCGTQFWARVSLLAPLALLSHRLGADFSIDYQQDGRLEHALERLFGLLPVHQQQRIGLLHRSQGGQYDVLQLARPLDAIGAATTRQFSTRAATLAVDKRAMLEARVFDTDHYTQSLPPELTTAGLDLVEHYLLIGNFQGLMPNRHFSPSEYRVLHGDIAKALEEPLLHYLRTGAREGRRLWRDSALEDLHAGFRFQALGAQLLRWDSFDPAARDPDLVSIVIPVYGQADLLERCVDSLRRARTRQRHDIVLVDNRKDAATTSRLRQLADRSPSVSLVENALNLNFALGCNLGFLRAAGGIIVFLNSDTEVTDGWLDALIAPLADPTIVALQPKLIYPDGRIQTIGAAAGPRGDLPHHLYTGEPGSAAHVNHGRPLTIITAACMAVRAEDFARVEGFDPLYLNGWEDVDLCLKLTADGQRRCWYTPEATVIHHESQSEGRSRYVEVNRKTFLARWRGKVPREAVEAYARDGYEVTDWKADDPRRVALGIAVYRPLLRQGSVDSEM